jgi:multisubunit Na+/H+ antiporter MnhF subunit
VTAWTVLTGVLLVAGLGAGLWVGGRGDAVSRLVGLQFAGATTTLVLVALALVTGQSSYLVVPLVLVLLSFAGTLVFTRLAGTR